MKSMEKTEQKVEETMTGTRDLFMETLTKIGCQYSIDEQDGRIGFAFQGENFVVDVADGNSYIRIWDLYWTSAEMYDVNEVSRLKRAINSANLSTGLTTVYTVNDAGSTIDVHCKSTVLFIAQIPDIGNYLRLELNEFFRAHRHVELELERLRNEESNSTTPSEEN